MPQPPVPFWGALHCSPGAGALMLLNGASVATAAVQGPSDMLSLGPAATPGRPPGLCRPIPQCHRPRWGSTDPVSPLNTWDRTRLAPTAHWGRAGVSASLGKPSDPGAVSSPAPPELFTCDSSSAPAPFLAKPSPQGCNRSDAGLRRTGGPEDRLAVPVPCCHVPSRSPC